MFDMKLMASIAAAGFALAASSAFADEPRTGANDRHGAGYYGIKTDRKLDNQSGACVRAYANGRQYDAPAGGSADIGGARSNHWFMVTIFPTWRCGGKGAGVQWMDNSKNSWIVYKVK